MSTAKVPSGLDGPSNSTHGPIPIDPVLLNQEAPIATGTPHLMCDVKVMTDTPDSLIHSPRPPHVHTCPSPTMSVLTDVDSHDLSTPIIGSQVHKQSETVQCDWLSKSRQLCGKISTALHISKAVILWQASAPAPATLDLDYLEDRGMSKLMRVMVHDAKQRTKDFTYPHQHATLAQFMSNIHDPHKIQCILDVPFSQGGLPSFVKCVNNSHGTNPPSTAAYWTNPHHDSDGGATFIQIKTGQKKWGLFRPINEDTVTRTNLSEMALTLVDLYQNCKHIQENWNGEIVTLLPGDILSASIQPAGQFHAVYMPVALFATGGHFYNYESMHLTELSHYIDHKLGRTLTNQVHEHSLATFH
ncbi:hypothetical protein BDR03DRAFT_986982 [Suillus americanus]|nr:hypothetical protein BDR03DRAFT_986982 [Suillus americanus]